MKSTLSLEDVLSMMHAYCKDYVGYTGKTNIPLRMLAQQFGKRCIKFAPKRIIDLIAEDPQIRFAVNMDPKTAGYYVTLVSPEVREHILEMRRLLAQPLNASEPQPEPSDS